MLTHTDNKISEHVKYEQYQIINNHHKVQNSYEILIWRGKKGQQKETHMWLITETSKMNPSIYVDEPPPTHTH